MTTQGIVTARTTGIPHVDKVLQTLEGKAARRITRVVVGGAQTRIAARMRSTIDAEPGISPELKRALKRTAGKRSKKNRRNGRFEAKIGLGDGKRKKPKRSGRTQGGIGISSWNVHWIALGTQPRRTAAGRFTGRVTPVRIVSKTYAGAKSSIGVWMKERAAKELATVANELEPR